MPRLSDVGERWLLEALARARGEDAARGAEAGGGVVVGSGDDAAVLRPTSGCDLVVTTDAFVEDVHYRPPWLEPHALGARLAAANLSDLAAMAATPRWGLLSMGVRANHDVDALLALQRGVTAALEAEKATVVGGNLARVQGAEWYDLTLVGEVERGRAWTRRGARPGDLVAVTGHPGRAGAGCALAQRLGIAARGGEWADLFEAWLAPRPRLALSRELAQAGCVTAAIDVSDGFASDLSRLCEAGGVGARLEERLWPVDRRLAAAAARLGVETDRLRFGASDDYELLLAIKPPHAGDAERVAAGAGVPFAVVGRFTGEPGEIVWAPREGPTRAVPASGWDHFGGDGPRA